MQSIFGIQTQVTSQIETYLAAQPAYSGYEWHWNQGTELGVEQLPAILAFTKTSLPTDGEREQNQDGSHYQTLHIVFRLFLPNPSTITLEALADSLYNDINTCLETNCRGLFRQLANPSMTYMFEITSQLRTADLEIPIIFMTNATN